MHSAVRIASIAIAAMTGLSALSSSPLRATAETGDIAVPPICSRASHERLVVRDGRDACGASLSRSGRPMAMGYLPTACPRDTDHYQIDAVGRADRCQRRSATQGEKS